MRRHNLFNIFFIFLKNSLLKLLDLPPPTLCLKMAAASVYSVEAIISHLFALRTSFCCIKSVVHLVMLDMNVGDAAVLYCNSCFSRITKSAVSNAQFQKQQLATLLFSTVHYHFEMITYCRSFHRFAVVVKQQWPFRTKCLLFCFAS